MKKQAPAYLSYLFTNLQAITAVGNRRCATSGDMRAITFAAWVCSAVISPECEPHIRKVGLQDDIASVLDHLAIPEAHIVGLSMGGFATLHFGVSSSAACEVSVRRRMRLTALSPISRKNSKTRPMWWLPPFKPKA